MSSIPHRSSSIWRLTDGKPGHAKQTAALAQAIASETGMSIVDIAITPSWAWWLKAVIGRFPPQANVAPPGLILGAGHGTHAALIAAGRATGTPTVVVMKPSVPTSWFDLALIPEHDQVPEGSHVITTVGSLSSAPREARHVREHGLIMIGGPSRHFTWDESRVADAVHQLVTTFTEVMWTLTTSRRTPETLLDALTGADNLHVVPFHQTGAGWVEEHLADSKWAWVTPDSVSMVYESLTAGCVTGLIPLQEIATSKVAKSILALTTTRGVILGVPARNDARLTEPVVPLNEAARCAKVVIERLLG